jgi:predicted transcriptional regulator
MIAMDKEQAIRELESLANLTEFATKSKIPRRTLVDLKAGKGKTRNTTLMLLDQALKRIKPKRKS